MFMFMCVSLMVHQQHVVALGNERPERLRATENAVWALLFKMTTGIPEDNAITELFGKLDTIDSMDGEAIVADWFVKSMCI
jgi:hypothetical protein